MHTVRRAGPADLSAVCAIWNAIWPNRSTDVEEMERGDRTLPEPMRELRWLAESNGVPAGMAWAFRPAGHFHEGKWIVEVAVDPAFRGQGIGADLYRVAHQHVAEQGILHLSSQVQEGDEIAIGFAERRGFRELNRTFLSELDLATVDPAALAQRVQQAAGYRFASMADLDSPEFRHRFHELFEVVRKDVPRPEPPVRMEFSFFEEQVLEEPNFLWQESQVALYGEDLVGFTGVYRGAREGWIDQWTTGVLREHRGKGVAFGLKAACALQILNSGFRAISTDNSSENVAMLAINEKMGFVRSVAVLTVRTALSNA